MDAHSNLAHQLDAVLPQTQCRRCGYVDCLSYAGAIARGEAAINRCPPGGAHTLAELSRITGRRAAGIDPACGSEGERRVAAVDEDWCIGCTRCIEACPVDAIVGAPRRLHVVIESRCSGCELCLPPCPVECIVMVPAADGVRGPGQWLQRRADTFRERYRATRERRAAAGSVPRSGTAGRSRDQRRAAIAAAVARTRAVRDSAAGVP